MQIKKDVKQEREQLSLKLEQFNELIAMYGAPQTSPKLLHVLKYRVSEYLMHLALLGRFVMY
ncbi:hypothetical protein Leryth_025467 [Lithospermum erythrorhizon]|nr:hypothetical protein Leryth_025467 [Lithospermum erythrorhizon]